MRGRLEDLNYVELVDGGPGNAGASDNPRIVLTRESRARLMVRLTQRGLTLPEQPCREQELRTLLAQLRLYEITERAFSRHG